VTGSAGATLGAVSAASVTGDEPGHLIHIGYPKAGSTFLQSWFASHPEIEYLGGGIAGYGTVWEIETQTFAPEERCRWRVTSYEGLATPRAARAPGAGAHAAHMADPEAQRRVCARLGALFPTAHVLVVTRGFRTVITSAYSEYVRAAGTDYAAWLARGAADRTIRHEWNYDYLLGLYRQEFGRRLHVLPYELLREDPSAFVGVLREWLGLTSAGPLPGQMNPSLGPVQLAWYPRLSRLALGLPLPRRAQRRVADAWTVRTSEDRLARLAQLLQAVLPREPVDPDTLAAPILDLFRGCADSLQDAPLYARYRSEYLLDGE
jgi:hypothetical protein